MSIRAHTMGNFLGTMHFRSDKYSEGRECVKCGDLIANGSTWCSSCAAEVRNAKRHAKQTMTRLYTVEQMMEVALRMMERGW